MLSSTNGNVFIQPVLEQLTILVLPIILLAIIVATLWLVFGDGIKDIRMLRKIVKHTRENPGCDCKIERALDEEMRRRKK